MVNKNGKKEALMEFYDSGIVSYRFNSTILSSGNVYCFEYVYNRDGSTKTYKNSDGDSEGFDKPNEETNEERKDTPVFSGVLAYFPDALKEVAKCSFAGQQQHNPDKPLSWDRSKSGNEYDSLTRHLLDSSKEDFDTDGTLHKAKVAWRALAGLQKHLENVK